ncbi:MAG: cysteine hydrolase [Atribacterota bacterium]|nr:cysteine hydrolase [Atribacterota bacterium]MDD4896473.1 cysteine hydrolase [Atribacterota bacterium]MDD5637276.1 cysteine hydrolase [Atribacterota bacterium]
MRNKQALLVIDMQKEGLLNREVFRKQELINNVNSLIDFFHRKNKPIFFIRHTNQSFLKENTEGWQICEELNLSGADIIINKKNVNVFREPHFLTLLKEFNITEVVITGLVSNGCIKAAVLGALEMGFSAILISDGHSTFHKNAEKIISDCNLQLGKQGTKVVPTVSWLKMQL